MMPKRATTLANFCAAAESGLLRRIRAVLLPGLLQAASAAVAQQLVTGTAVPCERNAIIASDGATSTLVLCAGVDRFAPELKTQLAQLESRLAGRDGETRREIDGLRRALNALARQLKPSDAEMLARSLAQRLEASAAAPDTRLFAELSRLRIDLREVNEKIDGLRAAPATASRTEAELQGSAGAALGRMEFLQASAMLDGLVRVEGKIDAMSRDLRDLAQPTEAAALLASDRRITEDAWKRFLDAGGQRRCPVLHAELGQLLQASREAEGNARPVAARNLLMTVIGRSMQATAELQQADHLAQSRRDAYQNELAQLEFDARELDRVVADLQTSIDEDRRRILAERANHEAVKVSRELHVKQLKEKIAQAQADLAAAQAMPATTRDEQLNKTSVVVRRSQELKSSESKLASAERRHRALEKGWDPVVPPEPTSMTPPTTREVKQDKVRQALARMAAAKLQAATLASSAQLDEAVEAIRLGSHEADALRRGIEAAPRTRYVSARVAAAGACR